MLLQSSVVDTMTTAADSLTVAGDSLAARTIFSVQNFYSQVITWLPGLSRIVIILVAAYILGRILRSSIRRVTTRAIEKSDPASGKRIQTLSAVLNSATGAILFAVVVTMVLGEFGVNLGPILAAAGVLGVAIGFGSQSLVKDFLNGFFFLFEGQVRVGDVVEAGGKAGLVEAISIRTLTLRDFGGNVHVIPHGEITTVTNMTKGFSRSVVEIGVAYREDPDHILDVLKEEANALREDPDFKDKITADPEVMGIDAFNSSDVLFKVRFTTQPIEQWGVARAFRLRVKRRFDRDGIEIPFPHQTLYWGEDKDHSAPPLQVDWKGLKEANSKN
ncbi:mechanosensitive ion channel family protein [bacterium]|nr:mechanosensitive ion channel family protein [bacterium]